MAILDLGKIKLLWRGAWASGTAYEKDDVVYSNGSVWICKLTHAASTSGEGLNRLAPAKRLRQSAYGAIYDPQQPTVVYQVTKSGGKFYLNGRLNPNFAMQKGHKYRFYVSATTMASVNFRFATSLDGTTYTTGVTTSGTSGQNGAYVEITVPLDAPNTLYYKQDGTAGIADTATITISPIWQGWQYWEEVSGGMKFAGVWANATQYYRNDVVVWDGSMYIALADSSGEIPDTTQANRSAYIDWTGQQSTQRNNHVWRLLAGGQIKRRQDNAMWLPNAGPINWPYLHNDDQDPCTYRKTFYISSTGRVYGMGGGTSNNNGYYNSGGGWTSYWTEVNFMWYDYYKSLDAINSDGGQQPRMESDFNPANGYNRLYNRSGEPPKCIQIEQNYDSTYFLFDNGELWGIGYNGQGNRGNGFTSGSTRPQRVMNLNDRKIIKVSMSKGFETSSHHSIALDNEGDVWCWGYNGYGQLGRGHTSDGYSPRRIPREYFGGEEIIDVLACGMEYGYCVVRTKSNNLYSWGYNGYGQLGLGDTTNRWKPTKILAFNPVTAGGILKFASSGASSASFHVLDGNGYLWQSGYNGYGTAINGSTTNNSTLARSTTSPTAAATTNFWASCPNGYNMMHIRTTNGNTYFVGYNSGYYFSGVGNQTSPLTSPTLVPTATNIKRVFMRGSYSNNITSFAISDKGEVFSQGYSNYNRHGNEYGNNSTIQDGTNYYWIRVAIPAGAKVIDGSIYCPDSTSNVYGTNNYWLCDNGAIHGNGFAGVYQQMNSFLMGNQRDTWSSPGSILYPMQISRGYAN
jgi:alpha-tubulin suppressor-like RCC1 family protein